MENEKMYVLRFLVQQVRLCIDLNFITKIFILPTIKKVPDSPDYVVGLVNIQSVSVPIVDLCLRLHLERKNPYHLNTSIILCDDKHHQMGFIVDKVLDIKAFEKKDIQMDTETSKNIFNGTIILDQELHLILNVERMINTSRINKTEVAYEHHD